MDKRRSERVQFFQLAHNDAVSMPVWVFQRTNPDTVLGVLLDVSTDGVQVLTDKSSTMGEDTYKLIIHAEASPEVSLFSVMVRRLWSKAEGALYRRNGFAFVSGDVTPPAIDKVLATRNTQYQWFRCELAAS